MPATSRRGFLHTASMAGAGYFVAAGNRTAWSKAASEQLNVACIGVGGKGGSDSDNASLFGNVVAICDVDSDRALGAVKSLKSRFPEESASVEAAQHFQDYRKMFDQLGNKIDAVTVSTPDHMHFPIAMAAMALGKHAFVEKPMSHTIAEARKLAQVAQTLVDHRAEI